MKKQIIITILTTIISACSSLTATPAPTQDINAIYTSAAQTNQAQMATAPSTVSPVPVTANPTTDEATSQSVAITVAGCSDSAQYVTDDGKDGTVYSPNTPFTKMWRIKNTGTCTWDSSYVVAFVSGTTMTQSPWYMLVPAGKTVAPGNSVDVSVGMMVPPQPGDYMANWQIQTSTGVSLTQFYLKLKVQDQTSDNAGDEIINVTTQIVLEQGNACDSSAIYDVTVNITSSATTTVDYQIDLTDGSGQVTNGTFSFVDFNSPEAKGSLLFDVVGTRQVILRVLGPYLYPSQVTVRSYVNGQAWPAATAICQ